MNFASGIPVLFGFVMVGLPGGRVLWHING